MLLEHLQKPMKEYKKIKEKGNSQSIYQNKLNQVCFQHDMAYRDLKDLTRRTAFNKALCDKGFNIAKTPKYDGYQRGLSSMV